jgi:hypothetical protein
VSAETVELPPELRELLSKVEDPTVASIVKGLALAVYRCGWADGAHATLNRVKSELEALTHRAEKLTEGEVPRG